MTDAPVPRLWRSKSNTVVAGVVGGLAERFAVNPTMLRVIVGMGIVLTGILPGVILYGLLWMITNRHHVSDMSDR